jgi:ketosteroid isomerase-like protein
MAAGVMICGTRAPKRSLSLEDMKLSLTALAASLLLLAGCFESGPGAAKDDVVAADKAFSAMSLKVGPKAAFLEYFGPNAKMLSEVAQGKDGINTLFANLPANAILSWEPADADASESGDLGYTWGRYILTLPTVRRGKDPYIQMGTYVTIWKHSSLGGWKVVLDGGHPDGTK